MRSLSRALRFVRRHRTAIFVWGVSGVLILGGLLMLWAATLKIPDLNSIQTRKIEQSLKIYDRTGTTVLYDINKNVDRTVVPLADINPDIRNATIAMEDPSFY